MKRNTWLIFALALAGCSGGGDTTNTSTEPGKSNVAATDKPLVVFSQANSGDPWRQTFDADMKTAAEGNAASLSFEMQSANDDQNTQISQVEAFLTKNPKVLLISPAKEGLKSVCEKAFDAGVAVILLDRDIPSEKYTAWIGGDNVQIGREAGEYIAQKLNGKGTVLVIKGLQDATPTKERQDGAVEVWKAKYPGIKIIEGDHCNYQRAPAQKYMEGFLQRGDAFDAIYAHNDEMAIGAILAMDSKGVSGKIVVGIDGCQQQVVDLIKEGKMTASFTYPNPAAKSIEIAAMILKGSTLSEKRIKLATEMVDATNADDFLKKHPNLQK